MAEGAPEDIVRVSASHTGKYLKPVLEAHARRTGKELRNGTAAKAGRGRKVSSDLLG